MLRCIIVNARISWPRGVMNKEVSAYLDCARAFAAFMVFVAHVEINWVPGVMPYTVFIGNQCLAVLFLLSGFLIGFVAEKKEHTIRDYFVHRAARIYSVIIPCVAVCFLLDAAGKHFMTTYYLHGSFPPLSNDLHEFFKALFSLTFLNEMWWSYSFPGSMAPFWTLPYEVSYYVIYAAIRYLPGWWKWPAAAALLVGVGPEIARFFPLWLMGVGVYYICSRLELSRAAGRGIFVASVLVWVSIDALCWYRGAQVDAGAGQIDAHYLTPFYSVGLIFSITLIGFRFSAFKIARYLGPVQWFAGATATLYLLHFPLARFINGFVPWTWHPVARWPLIVIPTVALSLLLAEFTERKKDVLRVKIDAVLDYLSAAFRTPKTSLPE